MKPLICSLFACFFLSLAFSQEREDLCIYSEILVYLSPEVKLDEVLEQWPGWRNQSEKSAADITNIQRLGIRHNIYAIDTKLSKVDAQSLLNWLQSQATVLAAQFNYEVAFRNTPNDQLFGQQWDLELIAATDAWEITTGGYTAGGTPIVVAIMDSGFEVNHEDLNANLWHNTAEVLGDGIDNDNNGYIDDDMGWNYFSDDPFITNGSHGTGSAGIIGGVGNNGIGVTGINWDLQMMLFTFSSVSDLIRAYEYVIDQRSRFNESNGQNGAFVVATNNSFGQSRIWCDQQPLWGAMYDMMGAVGILSSAGVANERYDVDISGDMPATCPSDYLLISCNTDEDDNLDSSSAYGEISVDLGSPGEESFTTRTPNTYGFFSQNSAATPHVTGAIALLYSVACSGLEADAINQPASVALQIKEMITSGVSLLPSMTNRTVTGGRLNLFKALTNLEESCSNSLGNLQLSKLYPNPTQDKLTVEYLTPDNGAYTAELYNTLGQLVYRKKIEVGTVGIRSFNLELGGYPGGFYFLRFGKEDEWVSRQVVLY
jgi:subtilisin family serine protease